MKVADGFMFNAWNQLYTNTTGSDASDARISLILYTMYETYMYNALDVVFAVKIISNVGCFAVR